MTHCNALAHLGSNNITHVSFCTPSQFCILQWGCYRYHRDHRRLGPHLLEGQLLTEKGQARMKGLQDIQDSERP